MMVKAILEAAKRGSTFQWSWCSRKPGVIMLDGTTRNEVHEVYSEEDARKFQRRIEEAGGVVVESLEAVITAREAFIERRDGAKL